MNLHDRIFVRGDAALIPEICYFRREPENNVSLRRVEMHTESMYMRAQLFELDNTPRGDEQLRHTLREAVLSHAYWFREASEYSAASQMYGLAARLGEPRLAVLNLQLKSRTQQ
jgi:hypothetical protein